MSSKNKKSKKTFTPLKESEVWFLNQDNNEEIFGTEDLDKTIGSVLKNKSDAKELNEMINNQEGNSNFDNTPTLDNLNINLIEEDTIERSHSQEIAGVKKVFDDENIEITNNEVKNLFEDILNNKFKTDILDKDIENVSYKNKINNFKEEKNLNLKINILKKELARLTDIKTQKELENSSESKKIIKEEKNIDKTALMIQATQELTNEKIKNNKKDFKTENSILFLNEELENSLKKMSKKDKKEITKELKNHIDKSLEKYALDYDSYTIENSTNDFDKTVHGIKSEKVNSKKWGYDNTTLLIDNLLDNANKISSKNQKKPLSENFDYDNFFDWIKKTKDSKKKK